nr:hypothetical protein [Paenibacillus glycinis]
MNGQRACGSRSVRNSSRDSSGVNADQSGARIQRLRLEHRDGAHVIRTAHRVLQPDRHSPVMADDNEIAQVHSFDEPADVFRVFPERVADVRLVGQTHADQIERDAAGGRVQVRNDIPIHVRPGRIAVQQQHGIARAMIDIMQTMAVDREIAGFEGIRAARGQHVAIGHDSTAPWS